MAGVVKFLAVNELPLRGDCETCDSEEDCIAAGLFAKLFKYMLEKDKYLADITSGIPQNAKYTSKTIQNEVIEILASMVLKKIKQKYDTADSAAFCLKSDGTRDRCNTENLSVIIRFVCNGVPEEHLIDLLELQQLDADYITTEILQHLSESGYSADNIMSQCYDGASVMSGVRGGVQALLQQRLDRHIPYIHCYNHQLHLTVIHAIQSEPCAKRFFDLSGSLHSFFRHHFVSQRYNCPYLKRLLEIRWTSHYEVTKCVVDNEEIILDILFKVSNDDNGSADLAKESSGLLSQLKRRHFFKIGKFLIHLLAILKPANAILQSQHVDLCSAAEVVQGCLGALKNLRENDIEFQQYCADMSTVEPSPKRLRTVNPSYGDSVIFSPLGQEGQSGSECATAALRRQMLNILDTAVSEIENRFSTKNLQLMQDLSGLMPKSNKFLDIQLLEPLCSLAGVAKTELQNEILVARPMLSKKLPSVAECSAVCKLLQEYKDAFAGLHKFCVSTASCE
uniref:DUF4371 domain-containing protein n=1 Tax=Cyprinus carpio TaxID=7962 RepID=A0A8C2BET5_CYPCA